MVITRGSDQVESPGDMHGVSFEPSSVANRPCSKLLLGNLGRSISPHSVQAHTKPTLDLPVWVEIEIEGVRAGILVPRLAKVRTLAK